MSLRECAEQTFLERKRAFEEAQRELAEARKRAEIAQTNLRLAGIIVEELKRQERRFGREAVHVSGS